MALRASRIGSQGLGLVGRAITMVEGVTPLVAFLVMAGQFARNTPVDPTVKYLSLACASTFGVVALSTTQIA